MYCAICGAPLQDGNSYAAYPFCHILDNTSMICKDCHTLAVYGQDELSFNPKEPLNIGTAIVVLWSKNSDKPITFAKSQGRFLKGEITQIDYENKEMYGTWGDFKISLKEDNFYIPKY